MLELTPEAIKKLEELIKEQTTDPEMAIRVSVHLSVPKWLRIINMNTYGPLGYTV